MFTADPDMQPTDCKGGTMPPVQGMNQGEIDYFDPKTKYPQNLRAALGGDRRLTSELTATADLMYTRDVNAFYTNDANLVDLGHDAEREMYGTVVAGPRDTITATPTRIDGAHLAQAIKVNNANGGGRVYSATVQLQKQFGDRGDLSVGYTYSNAADLMSFTSSRAISNFQFTPVDGSLGGRHLRPSAFDRPHKITVSGTARLPYGAALGLTYVGQSGAPYSYTVTGDVNADRVNGNDLVFVPADPSQITLQNPDQYGDLEKFINQESCLRYSRGHTINRGACRNPWANFLNLRLSWLSPKISAGKMENRFELQFDIFNVLNLLNSDWGVLDSAAQFETGPSFLKAVGYDNANRRPIYQFVRPAAVEQTIYNPTTSRWRMQLGLRYTF